MNMMRKWGRDEQCRICGRREHIVTMEILAPDRFEKVVGIKERGYRRYWIECLNCGLSSNRCIGENDQSLEAIRSAYYEIDLKGVGLEERYKKIMELPKAESDNSGRVKRVGRVLRWLEESHEGTIKVLDIGAGTGVFLASLISNNSERRVEGTAIESDPVAAEHLRKLGIADVSECDFFETDIHKKYNLVTMNKVLEHFQDMHRALGKAAGFLDQNCGVLYLEVPDSLTTRFRRSDDNILGRLHENLYSPESLLMLVRSTGLIPLEIKRIREPSGKLTCFIVAVTQKTFDRRELPNEA